jgi:hypothetical protein
MSSVTSPMPNGSWCIRLRPRPPWCAVLMGVALAQSCAPKSLATETCRFTGTTDYAGHVSVVTRAAAAGDTMRVGVALQFEATTTLWLHLRYLVEEISEWRNGALLRLDANTRYIFAGHVVRQQWDDFKLTQKGLQAYRIEGKRPAQFGLQYPRFAQHWDIAAFGLPWLDDYASAAPVRRPDLDLDRVPQSAAPQSPFALAFYWVRFLHPGAQHAQVFLPGFKADKLADIAISPVAGANGQTWHADLHHSYLSAAPPSTATAQIAADGHLQRFSFELHGSAGSAGGSLRQAGCTGSTAP